MKRMLAFAALLFAMGVSLADETAVRRMIQGKLQQGDAIESVRKLADGGLYEVVIRSVDGPHIRYVDDGAKFIVIGQLIDAKTGRNLTEARLRILSAIKWASLPFEWAVTARRGTGRRKIAIFSDPNCPYCERFEGDLAKLDDITVHVFLYPVIKPESVRQTKAVWCSKDRLKAWNDLMFRRIDPKASPDCDTPVEKLVELGRKLGASSTPTWFLENGERYSGALPLEDVRRVLDAASPK